MQWKQSFEKCWGLKRYGVSVNSHGLVYAAISLRFRTLTTHFHWVEKCTSTVLLKVWPVITVEVVCFMTPQIRSTYSDPTLISLNAQTKTTSIQNGIPVHQLYDLHFFFQQIKKHGHPVQNLMNKALLMSALYSTTQPSLLPRSAVVWSWACWWKQKLSYRWNVLHCQDLKLLPLITKAKQSWHESDAATTSHCIFSRIELDLATTSDNTCWGTS